MLLWKYQRKKIVSNKEIDIRDKKDTLELTLFWRNYISTSFIPFSR